jgi:lanosterol synthase
MTPAPTTGATEISTAAERAFDRLGARQRPDGSWVGEVVWCPMITAQYVIVQRILGREIDERTRRGIIRHFSVTRRQGAGWGLHAESQPYVFVTALGYVALRLLGVGPDDELTKPAREWLRAEPGCIVSIPTWGKFWLSLIGLYGAEGVGALPPELFTLPKWLPFHPHRWYCHTRYIYLAMSYLSGRRFVADLGPLGEQLRTELYGGTYEAIDFASQRRPLQRVVDVVARLFSRT